jgi:hypothetical protein
MKELKLLSLVLVAGTATMFTACTSESDNSPSAKVSYESVAAAQQVPVTFSTYIGESVTTRAGKTGVMDDTALQSASGSGGGFGVFGFYTDGATNSGNYNSASPTGGSPVNFMYNQGVFYNTDHWEYSPVKYWPNETNTTYDTEGPVDGSATSKGGPDKLTFFAYAPYVSSTPSTGAVTPATSGITQLTGNGETGDPKVTYVVASDADDTVDLLWAVAAANQTTPTVNGGTWSNVLAGKPFINLVKPMLAATPASTPINFSFKHALAKLVFTVEGEFDEVSTDNNNVDTSETRIVIDNVAITSTFNTNGILNLNNGTANVPNWTLGGTANLALNINNDDIVGTTAGSAGLKYNSGTDTFAGQPLGVTKTPQHLMDADGTTKFFALIPQTANMTITITYHVFTLDTNLANGYSKITNVITKTISSLALAGSNAYTINMRLGMETVSFTATVSPWVAESSQNVDLPLNVTTP